MAIEWDFDFEYAEPTIRTQATTLFIERNMNIDR